MSIASGSHGFSRYSVEPDTSWFHTDVSGSQASEKCGNGKMAEGKHSGGGVDKRGKMSIILEPFGWAESFKRQVTAAIETWSPKAGHAAGLLLKSLRNKSDQRIKML
ncbi:hypothetical protein [Moorena sp. SIO4G3]|uniref:hypothetical protein n=1 Tax=Moorena sp. SIO4G3 TaxID=2607821 RepID=UPI001429792F|nr:hypothetical protein [Moorena sp. SIO4G3]NEO82111.1 DUF3567 domain-containing protein [Moorena sp. SIO4G3]